MQRGGLVYIMTSVSKRVLYTGVTSNLEKRVWEHRNKYYKDCFTARFNCVLLVYYNSFPRIEEAINEEKRIKAGSRKSKERLIESMNPQWMDLWDAIQNW